MALKPFYNKKGHLGMTRQQVKAALNSISTKTYSAKYTGGYIYGTVETFETSEAAHEYATAFAAANKAITIKATDIPVYDTITATFWQGYNSGDGNAQYVTIWDSISGTMLIKADVAIVLSGTVYEVRLNVSIITLTTT